MRVPILELRPPKRSLNPALRPPTCSFSTLLQISELFLPVGGEVYLGLYDIVFPVVRHNIDMPRFKNKKKGEVCGWISVLFIIQCLLINHAVLMSDSFSTNEPLIEYLYEERI